MGKGNYYGNRREAYKVILLLPDGTMHSATDLANMYGVNQSTISRNYKQGKKTWTREELRKWREKLNSGEDLRTNRIKIDPEYSGPPRNIDDVIYSSSPIERALMSIR